MCWRHLLSNNWTHLRSFSILSKPLKRLSNVSWFYTVLPIKPFKIHDWLRLKEKICLSWHKLSYICFKLCPSECECLVKIILSHISHIDWNKHIFLIWNDVMKSMWHKTFHVWNFGKENRFLLFHYMNNFFVLHYEFSDKMDTRFALDVKTLVGGETTFRVGPLTRCYYLTYKIISKMIDQSNFVK